VPPAPPVPGITSEAAGEATRGTALEPAARAAGGIVRAGGVAALTRESAAANAVTKAFEHVPMADRSRYVQGAYGLMQDAEKQGVSLTWPEALKQASGGRVDLTGAQRVVEGTGRLSTFMGERPARSMPRRSVTSTPLRRPRRTRPRSGRSQARLRRGTSPMFARTKSTPRRALSTIKSREPMLVRSSRRRLLLIRAMLQPLQRSVATRS